MKLQRIVLNSVLFVTKDKVRLSKKAHIPIKALAVNESATALLRGLDCESDELTLKADRLYYSMSAAKPPKKLTKIF